MTHLLSCSTQVSEFKEQLFFSLGVPQTTVREFSCGHVIPEENLLALCLSKGPSGMQFDFTFRSRDTPEQVLWEGGRDVWERWHAVLLLAQRGRREKGWHRKSLKGQAREKCMEEM